MISRATPRRAVALAASLSLTAVMLLGAAGPASADVPRTEIAEAHSFAQPLYLTHAGDARLFVVERGGKIKIIHPDESVSTFLDVGGLIRTAGGEQGLLGLAFHPNYASNGLFYINYTRASDGDTVIAEYRRSSGDPDVADPSSRRRVLRFNQPFTNHNGGWMAFKGNNLFISSGDGGGNPKTRAQDLRKLLGKLLRINPLDPPGARRYSIPSGNPYVGRSGRDEIWSRGLRNPWRCSFDRETEDLWCGDVGQGVYEEINRSSTGKKLNYGWPLLEGRHYYNYPGRPQGALCTSRCRTLPILEYTQEAGAKDNCAVTGGYVSRRPGSLIYGSYVAGDFCGGRIWIFPASIAAGSDMPAPAAETNHLISSFGEDAEGYIYLVDYRGAIFRLDES